MSSAILNVTIDCSDPSQVADFWSTVTGYTKQEESGSVDKYWVLTSPDGTWPRLVFVSVPEAKSIKNRQHLDIVPNDRTQQEEIDRLVGLGASLVHDPRLSGTGGWVVLCDPEGNEFCVEPAISEIS